MSEVGSEYEVQKEHDSAKGLFQKCDQRQRVYNKKTSAKCQPLHLKCTVGTSSVAEPEPAGSTLDITDEVLKNILSVSSHIDKRQFKKRILI